MLATPKADPALDQFLPRRAAPPLPFSEAALRRRYARSIALYERARRVIPGGIHLSGRPLVDPFTSPMYFERGRGARIWDVDGHEYIDFMMAFGPFLFGYAHPEIDAAAARAGQRGRLLSMNHPLHIELIERLVQKFNGMDMGIFLKSGSEATTAALRIARKHTGRRRVVRAGYHGFHDWCLPKESFVPDGLDAQVLEFDANDPQTLGAILREHGGEIAAVILAPEMVVPHDPSVFQEVRALCTRHGALLVMDEVKTALRIAPGSISARVGIVPDLLTLSKALGNGYPIAAVLGTREVMECGEGVHYSATFHGELSAMGAALCVLDLLERDDVQAHVARLGVRLIEGLNRAARELSVPAVAYGEPLCAMPFLRFNAPDVVQNQALSTCFYREVLARGVLLHPRHMWFISAAHSKADIDATLSVAREALSIALARHPRAE
jgi:glutamate-1-semialdehyde 2,1-aminomutase